MNDPDPDPDPDRTLPMDHPPISSSVGNLPQDTLLQRGAFDPPATPGTLGRLDRFEILRLLGEGGMGQVYLAREPLTDTQVAIKVMKPQSADDPREVHRFLTEARHMYRLAHPRILRVLEVSDRPAGPYYVMPYIAGGSLLGRCKPEEPMAEGEVLAIARQVAEALAHAHAHGLIHRDLKPGNILLDKEGNAYLTDFGLVRTIMNDSMVDASASHLEGTAPYMSPAVARGEAEDTRCDIYAFGALLYELLTGQPPYTGRTPQIILDQVLKGPPCPLLSRNPKASPALVKIAEGCMARELRDRYASMGDVVSDLNRVANGDLPLGSHDRMTRSRQSLTIATILLAAFAAAVLLWIRGAQPSGNPPLPSPAAAAADTPPAAARVAATSPAPPDDQARYIAERDALPAAERGDFIKARLRELNPKYTGEGTFRVAAEQVVEALLPSAGLRDLSALASLPLVRLDVACNEIGDLSPLVGMPLQFLNIHGNRVQHLAPLHNMPLTELNGSDNLVSDLWPLRGMPLQRLDLANTAVFDLAPLQGMPLRVLNIHKTAVREIAAVKGMPLDELNAGNLGLTSLAPLRGSPVKRLILHDNRLHDLAPLRDSFVQMLNLVNTPVSDLSPLFGTPLEELSIERTQVSDLTPLHRSPLRVLTCDAGHQYAGMEPLRYLPTLEWVNPRPGPDLRAAAFWQRWDAAACRYTTNGLNVTVVGYTGNGGTVTLASRVGGRPLTVIGDGAFANRTNVTEVSIPDSVTSIHGNAFVGCTKLASFAVAAANPVYTNSSDGVILSRDWKRLVCFPPGRGGAYAPPHGVVEIGESAFRGRPVENVVLPAGLTTIGRWAFGGCGSLTNIVIPQGVTKIGAGAFEWCGRLRTARMPNSITRIEEYTFYHCSSLDIEIPASVVQIDDEAFGWTSHPVFVPASVVTMDRNPFAYWSSRTEFTVDHANPAFQSVDGVIFNKQMTRLVGFPTGRAGSYTIPPGVQTVGARAFYGAKRLESVTIPSSLTTLEYRAFRRCKGLKSIYFEGDAPKLGRDALSEVSSAAVYYRAGTKGWGPKFGDAPTAVWDPKLGFCYTIDKDAVTLMKYIGPGGDVVIPGKINGLPVTVIGDGALINRSDVTNVTIPNSVTSIGGSTFYASGLTNLMLPKSVTSFGGDSVAACGKLVAIEVDASNPAYSSSKDGVVFDKRKTQLVRYPCGKAGGYVIPDSVKSIMQNAFSGCANLTSITIPNGVTNIADYAFAGCARLADLVLPDSVVSLGFQTFNDLCGLTSLTIPKNVTSIAAASFRACNRLKSFTVHAENPAYSRSEDGVLFDKGKTCLVGYPGGKTGSYEIPKSVTKIGPKAFQDCSYLTSLTIPKSVTSIGFQAYYGCENLTAIYFEGDIPWLDNEVLTGSEKATVYHRPGTKGWGETFGGRPTNVWKED